MPMLTMSSIMFSPENGECKFERNRNPPSIYKKYNSVSSESPSLTSLLKILATFTIVGNLIMSIKENF